MRIDITMAKFTKRAIMLSLLKLLKQKSVDKVTVKDICDECEINRNTFYYYFKDIYDVLNNIFMEEIEKNLREAGSNGSFYEEYSRAAAKKSTTASNHGEASMTSPAKA